MTIIGSKLGNDFEWTAIKNIINYEQERDRAAILEQQSSTLTYAQVQSILVEIQRLCLTVQEAVVIK